MRRRQTGAGVWWIWGLPASPQRQQGSPLLALRAGEGVAKHEVKPVDVQGRILDPDGKPVRDAKTVPAFKWLKKDIPNKTWATSGVDGRFQFTILGMLDGEPLWQERDAYSYLLAAARGFGSAVAPLNKPKAAAAANRPGHNEDRTVRATIRRILRRIAGNSLGACGTIE